jgi:hypothetical protein
MKQIVLFLALCVLPASLHAQTVWSEGAYYPDSTGGVPAVSQIPWTVLTHVIMVGASPNAGGSLTYSSDFGSGNAAALITAAHAHSVKVMLGLSNVGSGTNFNGAMTGTCSTGALGTFITNITSVVGGSQTSGQTFDGVFVDYEESYSSQFPVFMSCLRTAMGSKLIEWFTGPTYMFGQEGNGGSAVCGLTSSWNVASSVILGIANNSDRVTVGAYDINDVYSTSYFGAPLYSADFATYGFTASGEWERQVEAACGIANSKLNLAIPFFGYVWTGNTAPYQSIGGSASGTGTYYSTLASTYNLGSFTYDTTAHQAWSKQGPGYISWDSPQSVKDKISYVYANSMGGWMIWTLGNDYISGSMPLLAAVGSAPLISFTPSAVGFPNQVVLTPSTPVSISIGNPGAGNLVLSSISITGTNSGDYSYTDASSCATATIMPGGTCSFTVTFKPTAVGSRTATVNVTGGVSGTVPLSGMGISAGSPGITFSPASIAFGNQTQGVASNALPITLKSSGTTTLTISSITVTPNSINFSQTNTCLATQNPNTSCTISVTFTPSTTGTLSASISVSDNAAGSPHTVALTGTGITAPPPPINLRVSCSTNKVTPTCTIGNMTSGQTAMVQVNPPNGAKATVRHP